MRKNRERKLSLLLAISLVLSPCSIAFAENGSEGDVQGEESKQIEECVIENIEDATFDGNEHKPKVVIYDGETALREGVDYQLTYGENIDAGTGTVLITGLGTYIGEVEKNFTIQKAKLVITGNNVASTGKPKISWKRVAGATSYKVYRAATQNGTYQYLTTTTKLSYVHSKAGKSKVYYYKIKAVDQNGSMKNFDTSNIVKLTCKLARPTVKAGNILKTGKPKLSWAKVNGAEKYMVYRATKKNGTYKYMTTTKNTEWIHETAVAGKKYYYRVKAIDSDNRSADSAKSTIVVRSCDLKRPVATITLNNKANPKLSWKKISGAEKYEVFRSTKQNGTYKSIGKTKNTYYTDKTAKGGKTYYYRVRAIDADNSGANSAKSIKVKIYVVDLTKKLVALTFDDGPGPYTKEIVQELTKNNAHATFFVLGQQVNYYPEALRAIYNGGNEIGNHSYSHPILSYEGSSTIKSQMSKTDVAIKNVVGIKPTLMRPPGGGVNSTVRENVGKPIIMWSVDTRDWETRDTQATINCVMREASDGDIVLMHDIHEPTKNAAVQLIPKLKKQGFELVTVSELAKFKGKNLKNGVVYYSF